METGTVNLWSGNLKNVMALASGNSIYILSHFVTDPAVETPSSAIVRIVGNVGKAGISLLIPPASEPLIRPLSNSLRAVEYASFDGRRENNFTSTSLHLSFTPHEFPLDYGTSDIIDHQVFFVESVVSVHDSGKWIADLNILGVFRNGARQILRLPSENQSKQTHGHPDEKQKAALEAFVSIDTWEEVLDDPSTHALVRASGSWAARLAAATNAARGPKFAEEDDDNDMDNERTGEKEEDQNQQSDNLNHHRRDRVHVAIVEKGESVCWVCVHTRLSKMGWLAFQAPCYIVA
ncbi:hypothetical protein PG997_006730 [Apiospora hydei]|uniref:Uncharacterized protein n=1 Tax=Apiospora hydei TaxID=1337664 RepID=A0ABR1WS29_9PEZI